jgi:hypothetical protein
MAQVQLNLREFYQRQAERLLTFAEDCTDRRTKDHLVRMAGEYIDNLHEIPIEQPPARLSRRIH